MAIELAQLAGDTCALADLQLEFGSVATYFDSRPAHTIADLTTASNEIDTQIVEQAMTLLPSNVAVLARPERVDQAASILIPKALPVSSRSWLNGMILWWRIFLAVLTV